MPIVDYYDRAGTFKITVDANEDLPAPDGIDPESGQRFPRKWLPCGSCFRLEMMPVRIVGFTCDACATVELEPGDERKEGQASNDDRFKPGFVCYACQAGHQAPERLWGKDYHVERFICDRCGTLQWLGVFRYGIATRETREELEELWQNLPINNDHTR